MKRFLLYITQPFAFGYNMVMGAIRFFIFVAAFAPLIPTMLTWMDDGKFALPDLKVPAKSYNGLFEMWNRLTNAFETIVCVLIMADMKLSTDKPFGAAMGKYSFLYLFKV